MTDLGAVSPSGYTDGMVRFRLREFLKERAVGQRRKDYSVREVATGAGVTPGVIQDIFTNKSKRIDLMTADKICAFLECDMWDWIVREPDTTEGGAE
jgi:DNA-binding Xre family transcriptional regulator